MSSNPQEPQNEIAAPPYKVRLGWWFGIYLFSVAIFPLFVIRGTHYESIGFMLLAPIFVSFVFPCAFVGVADFITWGVFSNSNMRLEGAILVIVPVLAYALYITHFVYTLKAKTRRGFHFQLLALVGIVGMNLLGCLYLLKESEQKPLHFDPPQSQR